MYFTAGIAVLMNTHHKNRLGIKDNLLPVGKIGNFYIGRAGGQIVVAVPGHFYLEFFLFQDRF